MGAFTTFTNSVTNFDDIVSTFIAPDKRIERFNEIKKNAERLSELLVPRKNTTLSLQAELDLLAEMYDRIQKMNAVLDGYALDPKFGYNVDALAESMTDAQQEELSTHLMELVSLLEAAGYPIPLDKLVDRGTILGLLNNHFNAFLDALNTNVALYRYSKAFIATERLPSRLTGELPLTTADAAVKKAEADLGTHQLAIDQRIAEMKEPLNTLRGGDLYALRIAFLNSVVEDKRNAVTTASYDAEQAQPSLFFRVFWPTAWRWKSVREQFDAHKVTLDTEKTAKAEYRKAVHAHALAETRATNGPWALAALTNKTTRDTIVQAGKHIVVTKKWGGLLKDESLAPAFASLQLAEQDRTTAIKAHYGDAHKKSGFFSLLRFTPTTLFTKTVSKLQELITAKSAATAAEPAPEAAPAVVEDLDHEVELKLPLDRNPFQLMGLRSTLRALLDGDTSQLNAWVTQLHKQIAFEKSPGWTVNDRAQLKGSPDKLNKPKEFGWVDQLAALFSGPNATLLRAQLNENKIVEINIGTGTNVLTSNELFEDKCGSVTESLSYIAGFINDSLYLRDGNATEIDAKMLLGNVVLSILNVQLHGTLEQRNQLTETLDALREDLAKDNLLADLNEIVTSDADKVAPLPQTFSPGMRQVLSGLFAETPLPVSSSRTNLSAAFDAEADAATIKLGKDAFAPPALSLETASIH